MNLKFVVNGTELSTGLTTFIISCVIVALLGLFVASKMKKEKNYKLTTMFTQTVDWLFTMLYDFVVSLVGKEMADQFMPLSITLFFVLLIGNTLSIFGIHEATSDLMVPITLVVAMFVCWTVYAIVKVGPVNYIKGYFQPLPFMFPLEVLGRITTPLSMALRIFGNILSGFIIMGIIWKVLAYAFQASIFGVFGGTLGLIIAIPLVGYFSLFSASIQALVFMSLTLVNFKSLVDED